MRRPRFLRGPYGSSLAHALVVLFGPLAWPGIWYFIAATHSWLWLVGSGIMLLLYWIREYQQTGLRAKPNTFLTGEGTRFTLAQRYVTWLNVLFPTFAYGLQIGLLHWFW